MRGWRKKMNIAVELVTTCSLLKLKYYLLECIWLYPQDDSSNFWIPSMLYAAKNQSSTQTEETPCIGTYYCVYTIYAVCHAEHVFVHSRRLIPWLQRPYHRRDLVVWYLTFHCYWMRPKSLIVCHCLRYSRETQPKSGTRSKPPTQAMPLCQRWVVLASSVLWALGGVCLHEVQVESFYGYQNTMITYSPTERRVKLCPHLCRDIAQWK